MKKNNSSQNIAELSAFVCGIALLLFACFFTGTGKLSYFSASVMKIGAPKPEIITSTATTSTSEPSVTQVSVEKKTNDITETPGDIKAVIEKYTELFANDKKDGDIKKKTYDNSSATDIYGRVAVKNTTDTKSIDIKEVLSQGLDLEIDKSKPAVLIFHSHTSEAYELIEREWYAADRSARSNDENLNVVRVGTEIADYIEKSGYTVIHDKSIHDENYSDSYAKSRKSIEAYLEEYPEILIVIDIHRDAMTLDNGTKLRPVTEINGKSAAQLMIITGAQEGKIEDFPDWEYNLRFALQLQNECEKMYPGLMRPVLFSQRKYNMDITHFSLLIEMGSEANTLEEACYSGRLLASAIVSLMESYTKD